MLRYRFTELSLLILLVLGALAPMIMEVDDSFIIKGKTPQPELVYAMLDVG